MKISSIITRYPKYKGKGCTACLKCVEVCESKAISVEQEEIPRPVINYKLCSSSFKCIEVCPEKVIHNRKLKYRDLLILILITLALLVAAIVFIFV